MKNLWCFDLSSIGDLKELAASKSLQQDYPLEWKHVPTRGQVPAAVAHHKTVVVGKNMYLIGGVMAGRDYNQSQMYRLDLNSLSWDSVGTRCDGDRSNLPGQIDEHTACLEGNRVIVFGGFEDGCRSNTIHMFEVETHKWSVIEPADEGAARPKPRAGHSATLKGTKMYIYGGKDDENLKLNDLWVFDLTTKKWTELHPTGD